jgi:hypothetical protein
MAFALVTHSTRADERLFTYTYEPETLPKGAWALEQWVTWRSGRTDNVGQDNYQRFEFREELEYGVTDRYTVALYYNTEQLSYTDGNGDGFSDFKWTSVSLENVYMVLNPAENPVGLSLYVEGAIGDGEAEIEQKIILGQRHGDWKWALNLVHATEWEEDFEEHEGELEFDFGLARNLGSRWALGFEVRGQSHIPSYEEFEDFALYAGPVVSYRTDRWFAALTVMPQIYGENYDGNPDGNTQLDLAHHERWNTRLIFGFNF